MVRGDGPPEKGERKMENRKREDFNKKKGKIKKHTTPVKVASSDTKRFMLNKISPIQRRKW